MKKRILSTLCILSCILLTACSSNNGPDEYVEGTDYQYMYYDKLRFYPDQAKGPDGMYFLIGSYIYHLDEDTKTMLPLCSKPECLHDQETDDFRLEDCNAYVDNASGEAGIQYVDGFIYTIAPIVLEDGSPSDRALYRLKKDGSEKERIYQWNESRVNSWCIHRNVFYYIDQFFDEDGGEHYYIKELPLHGFGKKKPRQIYEVDPDISVHSMGNIQAYGNHLYFSIWGWTTHDASIFKTDNYIQYLYFKHFQYNIQTKELSELRVPNQKDNEIINSVTFWDNKLLFSPFDFDHENDYTAKTPVYTANLDGTNAEVLFAEMPMYNYYDSDGTYLYVSDYAEGMDRYTALKKDISDAPEVDFTITEDVYDKDLHLIDSFQEPFSRTALPETGSSRGRYFCRKTDAGDSVRITYWDKSCIGKQESSGNEYVYTDICEQKYSLADQAVMNGEWRSYQNE